MYQVLLPVVIAFLVAFISTPIVIRLARKWGAMDAPCDRKVHTCSMPRMGGLAIYAGFMAAVLMTQTIDGKLVGILLGCTIIVLLGIVDDIKGLSPKVKLAGQTLAALVVVLFGVKVSILTNPFAEVLFLENFKLAIPFTVLWIVGVTNAVNLIDGLDGLAAGTSGIAAVTIGVVALLEGHFAAAVLAIILAGSVFGFLPFNFNPAKIFMGDTGSMFLGFTLSVLAVVGLTKSATIISVFIPVVILGIPIFDTMYAIIRRFLNGTPIFQADKEHLHHQLLNMGLTHKQTVLIIYVVNLCLGSSAVLMSLMAPPQAVVILIGLTVIMLLGMNHLSFAAFSRRQKAKHFGG
ncbi:glycosyltransferase family 4 protein [Desulfitibacter alkalitolerans]|uniref:glycosyltransferase family 4 protein n=1 Tax=Desulfitibacter alkalitolerans TaxID=264641 RepID=UPI000A00C45A|nr:MraY family glycosyltransferase [Desulfitibacter alkalitolerans]